MTGGNAKAFSEPQSLAHLLEFLAQLEKKTEVKKKVIEEIVQKVIGYVKDDGKLGNNGYLFQTITKSTELRKNILKTDDTYKHYNTQFQDGDANEYTKHLIDNIFLLFGCLYYMYFECSFDCYGIEGGKWYNERCDGSGGGRDKDHLNKWLKDEKGAGRMIRRGFEEGHLGNKKGSELFPFRESRQTESKSLLDYIQGAQLQNALYYMLFLPTSDKWNRGQSAHAVLFLKAFCEEITGGEFDDDHTAADGGGNKNFKNACEKVQGSIQKLLSSNTIVPVASSDTVKYKDLMADEHFGSYIKWLQGILPKLIESLKDMEKDVQNWTTQKMETSSSYGPYPWGFTFQSHWEEQKSQLNEPLKELSSSLSGLHKALPSTWKGKRRSKKAHEKSLNPTDSTDSSASTVGRVIGGVGAAAATAGAAYAGSGFLGPVAEGVGKFVRGLFF